MTVHGPLKNCRKGNAVEEKYGNRVSIYLPGKTK